MLQFTYSAHGDVATISLFLDGEAYNADSSHPNWDEIYSKVFAGDTEGLAELFNELAAAVVEFAVLSDRVTISGGKVHVDHKPISEGLSDFLVQAYSSDDERTAVAVTRFIENLQDNPSEASRENLFDWIRSQDKISITTDGLVVGYKGVKRDYHSHHSGPGYVNGVFSDGKSGLDNTPGNVISMAREDVDDNTGVACGTGLHVGTWNYVNGNYYTNNSHYLVVTVNPRDVVSVPRDSNNTKMRCARYKSVKAVTAPYSDFIVEL